MGRMDRCRPSARSCSYDLSLLSVLLIPVVLTFVFSVLTEPFVHADVQACFNGGSHSFRRRGEGLRQTFCPKVMREILPDGLERVGT